MAPGPFNHSDYSQMPFSCNCVVSSPRGRQQVLIEKMESKTPSYVRSPPVLCSNHYWLYSQEISFDQRHMPNNICTLLFQLLMKKSNIINMQCPHY